VDRRVARVRGALEPITRREALVSAVTGVLLTTGSPNAISRSPARKQPPAKCSDNPPESAGEAKRRPTPPCQAASLRKKAQQMRTNPDANSEDGYSLVSCESKNQGDGHSSQVFDLLRVNSRWIDSYAATAALAKMVRTTSTPAKSSTRP
jgi:hypothetical protein